MKIAIEGCAHGELDTIYEAIQYAEQRKGIHVDLLICCGDFQSTRNEEDLRCMAVPLKYQNMCSFYKYYSGEKVAPVLTLFIGGNHEASNYLQELAYGGWVAPNIYYLGYASIVNIAGVRIAGLSGIYKGQDYMKGHYEKPPYSEDSKRSAYHVRNLEIFRFKQVEQPIDIFLSHDWPRGIYHHGNVNKLIKYKPFFAQEISSGTLGSKPCEELLAFLKPSYWFSAHLHVKFGAIVEHESENLSKRTTKFLALDKCLRRRKFLQIIEVAHDPNKVMELQYDLEWLTIVHVTNHLLSVNRCAQYMPGPGFNGRWVFKPTEEELNFVLKKFDNDLTVPKNFIQTVTPYDPSESVSPHQTSTPLRKSRHQATARCNPQTIVFCERLCVDDPMDLLLQGNGPSTPQTPDRSSTVDLDEPLTPNWSTDCSLTTSPISRLSMCLPSPRVDQPDSGIVPSLPVLFTPNCSTDCSVVTSPLPISRLSMCLPSPCHDQLDGSVISSNQDVTDSDMERSHGALNETVCSQESILSQGSDATPESATSQESILGGETIMNEVNPGEAIMNKKLGGEAIKNEVNPGANYQPTKKKFKRRNVSMYISQDPSEDDAQT